MPAFQLAAESRPAGTAAVDNPVVRNLFAGTPALRMRVVIRTRRAILERHSLVAGMSHSDSRTEETSAAGTLAPGTADRTPAVQGIAARVRHSRREDLHLLLDIPASLAMAEPLLLPKMGRHHTILADHKSSAAEPDCLNRKWR